MLEIKKINYNSKIILKVFRKVYLNFIFNVSKISLLNSLYHIIKTRWCYSK